MNHPEWRSRRAGRPVKRNATYWGVEGVTLLVLVLWMLLDHASVHQVDSPRALALPALLLAIAVLGPLFPIEIGRTVRLSPRTAALFVMAVTLSPPLAGIVAGLSVAIGELVADGRDGPRPGAAISLASRWTTVVLIGSLVAHIAVETASSPVHAVPLIAAAGVMWCGDLLSLGIVPGNGHRLRRTVVGAMRERGLVEAAQYAVGLCALLLLMRQTWAFSLLVIPAALVYLASQRQPDEDAAHLLEGMADAVDRRDPFTGGHSRRVAELVEGTLRELGVHGPEAALIVAAARFHDIGKIGLPDSILAKSGRLTHEEESVIHAYPEQGTELLQRHPDFARGMEIVRHHHERWDGAGYPQGLRGTEIPFGARVIAVADAFDAMTSDRSYRRALTADGAASILFNGRAKQWDPQIVDALLRVVVGQLTRPVQAPMIHLVLESDGDDRMAVMA